MEENECDFEEDDIAAVDKYERNQNKWEALAGGLFLVPLFIAYFSCLLSVSCSFACWNDTCLACLLKCPAIER